MAGVQFYPLDIGMRLISDKPAVMLYGRTITGERVSVIDQSYLPYFYVLAESIEELEQELSRFSIKTGEDHHYIVKTEKKTVKLNEKETPVLKVCINNSFGCFSLYNELIKNPKIKGIYEHDINFVSSYLIDKKIIPGFLTDVEGEVINQYSPVAVVRADSIVQEDDEAIRNPKILAFDLETYAPKGKPGNTQSDQIVMISFYSENLRKTITWKKFETEDKTIEFVGSESDLISRFKRMLEEFQPDFLVGYASDIFAFPYIKQRADKYGIKLDIGIDRTLADVRNETAVKGIVHADIYKFIYRILGSKLATDNFRLEEVAMEILGEGKKSIDIAKLAEAFDSDSDLTPYCEYNLNDASLIYRLFVKMLPYIFEFAKLTNLELFDIIRGSFSQFTEAFLMKESRLANELIPPRPARNEQEERASKEKQPWNALESVPGVYSNIAVYGFQSLHPSIISLHNISSGTLRCRCCNAVVPGEEMHFCAKTAGFFPKIIGALIDRKQRIVNILNDDAEKTFEQSRLLNARHDAISSLTNALCGYFSYPSSRWYNEECAKAMAAYGRHYIASVIQKAESSGFEVLHADNDCIFLNPGSRKKEDFTAFFNEMNSQLPEKMQLEYEGFYPRGMFIASKAGKAKKKYALLSEKGYLKIIGLESSRRNFSTIAKEVQENVLNLILKERKLKKAMEYVQAVINNVKEGKIPMKKMVIYTHLQKDISNYETIAPHVAVAKKMQKQGFNVTQGSIIRYVVSKGEGSIAEQAQLPNEVASYDPDYYIEHQIIPAVERIFEAAGVDFEKALNEKEQSSLGEFI